MTAGDRCADYREGAGSGDGLASNLLTRAVLRELCRVAHDAGIAQVGVVRLAARIGAGERSVRYALQRLQRDGAITLALRGTGNRHGSEARESVWVLHPLRTGTGLLLPEADWLNEAWLRYLDTPRWCRWSRPAQHAVAAARQPVENVLLAASQPPTSGNPLPHISLDRSLEGGPPRQQQRHPQAARRARSRFAVISGDKQP
jgi:hypothetical protein